MDNHYHLLLKTLDPNLSLGMRQLNGVYTQRFNRQHSRVGHVFQGRFKSILVEKEAHLIALSRYIVLNPVAAGMVVHPSEYAWSSFNYTVNSFKKPEFLYLDWLLSQFSSKKREARKQYREYVVQGLSLSIEKPWMKLVGQMILGSENFVSDIQNLIAEKKDAKEIPKLQRYHGRPSLAKLLGEEKLADKKMRNRIICKAHLSHGYTLKEIGEFAGIHYSTVSRIVKPHKI